MIPPTTLKTDPSMGPPLAAIQPVTALHPSSTALLMPSTTFSAVSVTVSTTPSTASPTVETTEGTAVPRSSHHAIVRPTYGATKQKLMDGFNVGMRHSQSNQKIATNGIGPLVTLRSRRLMCSLRLRITPYHSVQRNCVVQHSKFWPPMTAWGVRRGRRRFPVGERPTRQSLQPEAAGAAMEVTK